jgi:hypothetical protein
MGVRTWPPATAYPSRMAPPGSQCTTQAPGGHTPGAPGNQSHPGHPAPATTDEAIKGEDDMTTPPSVDQFLSGGGAPAAKWPKVGDTFGGTILDFGVQPQMDYDTGEALYFDRGSKSKYVRSQAPEGAEPMYQLEITVQGPATGVTWKGLQNTPVDLPDDDGKRRLFVRAALRGAIIGALKDAGNAKLEIGARVDITRVADKAASNPKYADSHQYEAVWTPAGQNPDSAMAFLATGSPEDEAGPADEAVPDDPWAEKAEPPY